MNPRYLYLHSFPPPSEMGSKSLTSSLLPFDGSNKVGCPYSVVEAIRVESGASSKLNFVFEAPLCVCSRGISCGYRVISV
ncbi:hypothetical protein Lalb_Chr18g0051291 [Lupinus albus]|uniref:Uncharacterized protein n=1 Tax=Lupinus albus TaxID=3870 RepID=A0A6A4NYI7_LUPAL|nr:hypothetical protein Lalb_Chr00c59g0413821 [Lupinus albus]KAE9594201.1 hypothetical protein Lalb_Chr18g0051291 [Lupinus albus]